MRRIFLGFVLSAVSFLAKSGTQLKENRLSFAKIIATREISFQVGRATLAPQEFTLEKLLKAVTKFNSEVRLPGLDDELNAEILDPEKVRAFIERLPDLTEKEITLLAGRTVILNIAAMRLHLSSAVSSQQLGVAYRIATDPTNSNAHLANVQVIATLSVDLARQRIQAARDAVAYRDKRLSNLSVAIAGTQIQAAQLRQERRSAGIVWLTLALDLSRQNPVPPDAAALVEEAKKVLQIEPVAPSAGGMPG